MLAEFLTKLIEVSKSAQQPVKIVDPHDHVTRHVFPDGTDITVLD